MALHQYIGARYVPKFYENSDGTSEWRSGVIYEPLTVVTWNGNSYTSKKPVPADIGDPSANTAYWVATGLYNEQVQAIADDLADVKATVETLEKQVTWYVPEMFGAVGDGVTDDGPAIQDMFDSIPDESVVVFSKDKYYTAQQIVVYPNNLIIRGELGRSNAGPQIRSDLTGAPMFINRGSGCSYHDLWFWNPTGTYTDHFAILFDADNAQYNGNVDARLKNCAFTAFEEAVQCKGRNLEVGNCAFQSGRFAVHLMETTIATDLRGYDIHDCRVHSNQVFVRNDITNLRTPKNIKISSNLLDFASTLYTGYGGGVVIDNNVLDAKGVGGTLLTLKADALNSDDYINYITNNTFYGGATTTNGISCEDGVKVVVAHNLITNVKYNGIAVSDGGFGIIKDNVVENCGQSAGTHSINCFTTTTGLIEGNVMYNCTRYAVGTAMTIQNNYQL